MFAVGAGGYVHAVTVPDKKFFSSAVVNILIPFCNVDLSHIIRRGAQPIDIFLCSSIEFSHFKFKVASMFVLYVRMKASQLE